MENFTSIPNNDLSNTTLNFSENILSNPLNTSDIFTIPGETGDLMTLNFEWIEGDAAFDNEVGVFVVDELGQVGGIAPGEEGYAQAAINDASSQIIFSKGQEVGAQRQLTFQAGDTLGFYLIQDDSTKDWLTSNSSNSISNDPIAFFSIDGVNPDQFDHIQGQDLGDGVQQFRWEDSTFGGDRDFNDVVFNVSAVRSAVLVPGESGEIVPVTFNKVSQEASFHNEMGLFVVDDAQGRIGSILPGQPGYIEAALSDSRRDIIFARSQTSGTAKTIELPAKSYVGFYLIQNASTESFLNHNPQNELNKEPLAFFFFPQGNPDGIDHLQSVAANSFGWEDLTNGGDKDFDDLVFEYTFDTPTSGGSGGDIQLSIDDVVIVEGDTNTTEAKFTVSLSAPSSTTVTVDFSTADDTAITDADYQAVNGTITFKPGETTQTIIVPIIDDRLNEADETFFINLTNASNAIIADTQANGTIIDDELPSISASLANDTGASDSDGITLDPTINGQATGATSLQGNLNGNGFVDISDALNEDGSFTISLEQYEVLSNQDLPDGNYILELKAENDFGRESDVITVNFTLDRTPPPIDFDLAPQSDTGELGDKTTTERIVTLVGQTEPGLEMVLVETQQMVTADSDGNFSLTDVPMPIAGTAPFSLVTVDIAGNLGRVQKQFTRIGINGVPEIISTPEAVFDTDEQDNYTYQIEAVDPDNDTLTYSLLNGLQGVEIDTNGLLTFTPEGNLRPSYDFNIEISDGRGGKDTQAFTVEIPALANSGTIKGIKWNDLNGNGVRDSELVQGANPDVVYVLDVSGSADDAFVGSPIGDFNNDGLENTRLDAEIAAFIALNEQLNNQGLGDNARVAIVVYSGFTANADMNLVTDGLQLTTTARADSNNDGTTDIEEILRSIRSGALGVGNFTGTNPEAALQKVEETFTAIGTQVGNGNVIFLTDGEQNRGGSISDEVERLQAQGFNLSAFGVGDDASLSVIQTIDADGIKFTSIDEILNAFGGLGAGSKSVLEPGLAGVSVYLDSNNNGILDNGEPIQISAEDDPSTADIDETGQYEFTNLVPGTYIVREVVPDGFEQTFPLRNQNQPGDGYADVILEFVSGGNAPSPLVEPYGSTGGLAPSSPFNNNGQYTVEPVNPEVILGAPPPSPIIGANPEVDWLALPQGSYVTIGFTDEVVIDGPGDDIFIRSFDPQDSANEFADVFVSSNGVDFEFLGTVNERGLVSLDLADINFTEPVTAVRVQGLDNRGSSPGFDLIGVEVLPGSIASPDFYTIELNEGEIVENVNFGNVEIAVNQDPVITSTPIIEAVVGQLYEYLVRANDPDGDTLTYNLNEAPEGMVIDSQTGQISYTPAITATTFNFDTSDNQIRPGIDNQVAFLEDDQGITFSNTIANYAIGETFNVFSGQRPLGPVVRSAVSFDLNSLSSPVTSAKLQLRKNLTNGDPIETLGLFEVTTDINQLYKSDIVSVSPEIFEDLGTGTSYGTFDVATLGDLREILEFELNEAAIAAINVASGDFFSIGLSLLSANPNNTNQAAEYLFAFSNNTGVQRLVLETENKETVEVLVSDGNGGEATQNYTLNIVESSNNQAPVITSIPELSAVLGETYEYQVEATDPDGDVLNYSLINFPDGLEIDDAGKITWNPTEIGEFELEIEVSDAKGGVDTQVYKLEVLNDLSEDTEAPQVEMIFNGTVFELGETLNLQIQGFDNIGLADLDLSFDSNSLALNPDTVANGFVNTASVTLNDVGVFELLATATDLAGNTDTEAISVRVIDPTDTESPSLTIDLTQFAGGDTTLESLTNIIGTVEDENLEFFRLEIAPISGADINNPSVNDADYTVLAQSNSGIDGVLGTVDPRKFANGSYFLRAIAGDFSGNINIQGIPVTLYSAEKSGQFRIEITDLTVPLAGIPIQINRVYDSFDADESGDFGFGWSLKTQEARIEESAPVTDNIPGVPTLFSSTPFKIGDTVTLTNPNGERVSFIFDPFIDGASLLGAIWKPRFTPAPGVFDRLEVDDIPLSIRSDGSAGLFLFSFPYNPENYRLITPDGTSYSYNQFDGLQEIEDTNGNTLTYSDSGIVSSTGEAISFTRDSAGRITAITDPNGNTINYSYDANGDLIALTDQENLTITHSYLEDNSHYLDKITDPRGKTISRTEFDNFGRITKTTDALGNTSTRNYIDNPDGTITEVFTNPEGEVTTTVRDGRGNIVSLTDVVGATTTTVYDENNNPIQITDPRGFTTTRTFDARGNITSITDALDNTTTFTYDQLSNVTSETDSLGRITQFNYDDNGNLVELIDATGESDRFAYDDLGRVSSFTDANGNSTNFDYDGTNSEKPTKVTFPDGGTQQVEYNQFGQITRLVDENSSATEYITDSAGRLITVRDPLGNETTYTYDAQLITSVTDPDGNTERYEYDDSGRLIRQINPLNGVTEFGYDALGRRISETDPLGNTTTTTYRDDGLITAITDAEGNTTNFEYDLARNQTAVIDPLGNRTTFDYDALGRQISQTDPLGNVARYSYDAVNNLIEIIDRNNRKRNFSYDAVDRLTQEQWLNNSTPVETINFTYDEVGNLLSATNSDSTNTFTYNDRDRLTQVSTDISGLTTFDLNYSYDGTGNRTSVSDNLGVNVNSTYDPRNLLTSQTWQGTGIDLARVEYSYNENGDRTQIERFSNVNGTQLVGSSTFEYDALRRLTEITHFNGSGNVLVDYEYNYNAASFLNSETYKGQTTNYTYDKTNQLTNADRSVIADENYTYDDNGNPTGNGFVIGANNQILSNGEFNYSYDNEGNLTSKTNIATGDISTYTYDFRNRLVKVLDTDTNGNATQTVEFEYDAFDRRISKTVDGETKYFINDGDDIWAELNQAGEIVNRYLQSANVDELIARYNSDEGINWYLTDRLGTMRDVVNEVGNLVNSINYDSFGEILGQTNPNEDDRFGFTGREYDEETGLYYYRARYYDPSLGRFISQDPIGFGGEDANLYRYVGNNPVNATDPSGLLAALEYGSIVKAQVLDVTGTVPGAIIGGLQGFGITGLIFIGNILEIANRGGDVITEWGSAIGKTRTKLQNIETQLKRFGAVDTPEGLVKGFVSGAGVDIFNVSFDLPIRGVKVGNLIAPNASKSIALRRGGFKEGYEEGLKYLRGLTPSR